MRTVRFYGSESFTSSASEDRDIYIQWLWDIKEDNKWIFADGKSLLITSDQIKTIEFWPYQQQEISNEQE